MDFLFVSFICRSIIFSSFLGVSSNKKKKDTRHSKTSKFRQANNGCRLIMYKIYRKKKGVRPPLSFSTPHLPAQFRKDKRKLEKRKNKTLKDRKETSLFKFLLFSSPLIKNNFEKILRHVLSFLTTF